MFDQRGFKYDRSWEKVHTNMSTHKLFLSRPTLT